MVNNVALLNDDKTKPHVDQVTRSSMARMRRAAGKPIYDVSINRMVGYEMPRHFLGIHSQRRIKTLESYDDLTLPEFLQGFVSVIMRVGLDIPTSEAMTRCLGMALVDYQWEELRDWINSVLHDVGQGRITWLNQGAISDHLNDTKMQASRTPRVETGIPVCGLYNQGKCSFESLHGSFRHICVSYWLMAGAQHSHSLTTCRHRAPNHTYPNNNNRNGSKDYYNRSAPQQHNANQARQHNNHPRDRQQSHDIRSYGNDNQPTPVSKN